MKIKSFITVFVVVAVLAAVVTVLFGRNIPFNLVQDDPTETLGLACAWGETRCSIVDDHLKFDLNDTGMLILYALVAFPPSTDVYAVMPKSYMRVRYDSDNGWICFVSGDVVIPVEMGTFNFKAGAKWVPPPMCIAPLTAI